MRMKMQSRKDIPVVTPDLKPVTRIDFGDHYPDGGWGWVIISSAMVVYILCNGFHFAFGTLLLLITEREKLKDDAINSVWLGSTGMSITLLLSPLITTICRRKSPRLYAVIGGLISSLGSLFLAFSEQIEQLFISHCVVLAIGTGITLNTANIIVGRYFWQKRELAEMLLVGSTGIGSALMAYILPKLNDSIGWDHTLQSIAGLLALTMFAGAMYRSASLYHPRRSVILHIKNQKKSRRERDIEKPSYFDFSALRMRSIQGLMFIVAVIALGIHVPFIMLMKTAKHHGLSPEHLFLLNVFLGLGFLIGCLVFGFIIIRDSSECAISRRHLCQSCVFMCGTFTLLLIMAKDFNSNALYAWGYGIACGGYYYTMKMYIYELVKEKIMERGFGFINAAQFLSYLLGPPLAVYLNESYSNQFACYIFAGVTMLCGGLLFYCMPPFERHFSNHEIIQKQNSTCSKNSAEAAALLDLDLTDAIVTKPLNNVQFIVSPSRMKNNCKDGGKIQMQCFIQHIDKEKPKQIVLSRITEDKEGLRLDFNEVPNLSSVAKGTDILSNKRDTSEKESSHCLVDNHVDYPSESTNSHNTDKTNKASNSSRSSESKKFRRSSDNVKIDYFDPPSQEKESTATVSYDSDLYINLCEAQV
ncbi:hypothetical protein ACJMK2_029928 [Sinanodonta woodiana]|uniref:Uncharacterized protein n=1 Tax=Sinanodonta woodiana TaxID=1069815 RepID=A0ABD3XDS2_SINWO